MQKIDIIIEVTSLDSETSYNVIGELKNGRIKFADQNNDMNYIICKDDLVEYYKKGNADMKYAFHLDKVTKGYYSIMGNKFEFDIVTNILQIDEQYIYIKYNLYQNSDLVNKTELKVSYQIKEES